MRRMLNRLATGLCVFGLLATARPAARWTKRTCFQLAAAAGWEACRSLPASGRPGEPCAWLRIPDARISLPVLKGTEKEQLARAPGCRTIDRATLILAHRDTHFRGLKDVRTGNPVTLELRDGQRRRFRITECIITDAASSEQTVRNFSHQDRLILLTCYPFHYIGPAPFRIIFLADPADRTDATDIGKRHQPGPFCPPGLPLPVRAL
jgi:LPXTG-site transpeptidase (sortase) family protein